MEIWIENIDDTTVAVITGRIDSTTSKELEAQFIPMIDSGTRKLLLDFTGVDFISSAGLRVMLVGVKRQKQANGVFALCCLKSSVREIFDISGFGKIIPIFPTREEALIDY